ncbi:hypothetical protein DTO013E5_9274 [Penicillium roqueforti]|uniref:Genomic scaffold, ProqFM164S02 n=1 Tax=Penicillium roqueforti (strain FM164) TaxID=1365484 RepID=W6Q184_PENRF|nr:uncharacterized protein LCP9604111_4851 [Penicillium roqueforti]CDM30293.1 unnamed protein product [Penicillium roqueforti FM164]KAF9249135.1 hypothetical protein LCP9604111_4851 [Penicillium roqueforti]KAI1832042.1 hypothetical protein CBS147337_7114 [Penicillium roqueforti]KAI2673323.1 hypothetical protein CBS147355_7622 [Penicillium roqueforti]KAI2677419.1 hypothetical protein LCP963914a_8077 [Penicillium roqueforti]
MIIISAVELNVAVTAANVPSFKAIWRKHVNGTLKGNTNSVNLSEERTLWREQCEDSDYLPQQRARGESGSAGFLDE